MTEKFQIYDDDKRLGISGPWDMEVLIDYDDVDHNTVRKQAEQLCNLLNKHWKPSRS